MLGCSSSCCRCGSSTRSYVLVVAAVLVVADFVVVVVVLVVVVVVVVVLNWCELLSIVILLVAVSHTGHWEIYEHFQKIYSTNKDIICRWEVYIQRRKKCIQYPIPPVGFSFFRVFWCQFPLKPPGILNEDDSVTFSDSAVWNPFDFFFG